jgi:hypothetical protein
MAVNCETLSAFGTRAVPSVMRTDPGPPAVFKYSADRGCLERSHGVDGLGAERGL